MKVISGILLTLILCLLLGPYAPWWIFVPIAFLIGIWAYPNAWLAFIGGFIGAGLAWGGMALYLDQMNGQVLSSQIAQILKLPSPFFLILITTLVGGFAAGISSLNGFLVRNLIRQ